MTAFLRSARELLRNDGVVILAGPDKCECFDYAVHRTKRNASAGWRIDELAVMGRIADRLFRRSIAGNR